MKSLLKGILLTVLLLLLTLMGMLMLAVEDKPTLFGRADLSPERIGHAKRVFFLNDPRRMRSGSIVKAYLRQEDLNLAINYIANQYVNGVAGLGLYKDKAIIESSLRLPKNPLGRFLNLKLEFTQTDQLPKIDKIMLGKLWIPGFLAEFLVNYGLLTLQPLLDWQTFASTVKKVEFYPRQLIVTYLWEQDLPAKVSGILMSVQDQKRIDVYQRRLADLVYNAKDGFNLTELTKPLFQLAKNRSNNDEAVAENRALILVLAFYVNQRDLSKIIPNVKKLQHPAWRQVKLTNRDDFPKHYLVSAMLAAYSGTPFSNALGLYKEIEDSRRGSGFSFNDIAADRAGTRMGELAVVDALRAQKVQSFMATANESDIMPMTADLPEFIPESDFVRRFGGIKSEPYLKMMEEIERRIAELPINRL